MPVEIDQIIRSKRKTLALVVRPDGTVLVRAPFRASHASIQEFVTNNRRWIEKKKAQVRTAALPVPKQYVPGEKFEYLGKVYPLEIRKEQKKGLVLEQERFTLAESAQDKANLLFEQWYRNQARGILEERVNLYAHREGFHYTKLGITSARTRWGSCSATGSLSFSWRLIQAPMEIVDYVVVHELVHTVFHDHSKRFWKRVEQILPDYKARRDWLKRNGLRLLV